MIFIFFVIFYYCQEYKSTKSLRKNTGPFKKQTWGPMPPGPPLSQFIGKMVGSTVSSNLWIDLPCPEGLLSTPQPALSTPWAPSCWSTQKGILLFAKILLCLVILICLNWWSNDVHYYLMYHLYVLPVHRDIDYQLALEWFLSDPHSSHPLPDHLSCCPCWERKSLQNHHGATGSNHGWLCGYNAHVTAKTQQPTNPAESQV